MKKWQENVLSLDESLRDIIDKINNCCLVYSEFEAPDSAYKDRTHAIKKWVDCDGDIICIIRDDYEATFYKYDSNKNQIYNSTFYSIDDAYYHIGHISISSYDAMSNKIYKKVTYLNSFTEERNFYNENNKMIKSHFIRVGGIDTNNRYFYDENGKFIFASNKSDHRYRAAKIVAILNPSKTGYRRCSFFGYDQEIFDEEWETVYHKYKLNKKEAQNEN